MNVLRRAIVLLACACLAMAAAAQTGGPVDGTSAKVIRLKGAAQADGAPLAMGHSVKTGSTITTGEGARVDLEFPDHQKIYVDQSSRLRIVEYEYTPGDAQKKRARFALDQGAARAISGEIARELPAAVELIAPQSTFSVQGTDYIVSLFNPAYVRVISGRIVSVNSAGSVVFGRGNLGTIADARTLAQPIPERDVPQAVRDAFARLMDDAFMASGPEKGAEAAAAAAPDSGPSATTWIVIGVGAALIGGAGGGGGGAASATSH